MNLRSVLTARYVVALSIVAVVLLANHLLSVRQTRDVEDDGYVINISGMQRMLSQRVALRSLELRAAPSSTVADGHAKALERALERYEANHAELSRRWRERAAAGDALYAGYLDDGGIGEQVREHLALGRRLLETYRSGGLAEARVSALPGQIVASAGDRLLERLDGVVSTYEREFEAKMHAIARLANVLLAVGLLVLVLEALCIFRPMASTIASTITALERANGELRAFSYRVAHDLRAPVASSLGLIGLVHESMEEGDTEDAVESVGMIRKAMAQLDVLIGELIALVRTRQIAETPEAVDLPAMLDEVMGKLSFMPDFERVAIRTRVELDGPVRTKPLLLRQILQNLLSNAIKYADPAKRSTVDVSAASDGRGRVRITVSDNGVGIPEGSREEVFGMFKRFHPKIATGSGLGLYLVACSAEEMGGDVEYAPLPDGSAFTLIFPDVPAPATASGLAPSY